VNNAHLLRVRSILELSEKRLAEAVAQVVCVPSSYLVSRVLTRGTEPRAAEELRRAGGSQGRSG
jgi:hypothetical protein